MSRTVLDASALLALLFDEPGAGRVERALPMAVASTVNWVEVCQRLLERGGAPQDARTGLLEAGLEMLPLSVAQAERAAALRSSTRRAGLSLGDRCCLALASGLGLPALTADASWTALDVGAEVELIR